MKKRIWIILFLLVLFVTSSVSAETHEPFVVTGTNDDVVEVSLDFFEYPLLEFYSSCEESWQPVTLTMFFADGEQVNILDSASCDHNGIFYVGHMAQKALELIQIEAEGDWRLALLPSIYITWFESPVTMRGNGAAVFIVNNHGRTAAFQTDSETSYEVIQYGAQDPSIYNEVFYGWGAYSGKKMIKSGFPLFSVIADGNWELSFDGGEIVDYFSPTGMIFIEGMMETSGHGYVFPDFLNFESLYGNPDNISESYFLYYLLSQFEGIQGSYQIDYYAKLSDPENLIPEILNEQLVEFYNDAYPDEHLMQGYPLYGQQMWLDYDNYRMVWRTALTGRFLDITFFFIAPDETGNQGPYEVYIVFSPNAYPKG